MALITCPECGRENVSDSAIACPGCGFGIKDYYDAIREQKNIEKEKNHSEYADSVVKSLENDIKMHQERRAKILAQQAEREQTNNKEKISITDVDKDDKGTETGNDDYFSNQIEKKRQSIFIDELKRTKVNNTLIVGACIIFLLPLFIWMTIAASISDTEMTIQSVIVNIVLIVAIIALIKRGIRLSNDIDAAERGDLKYDMIIVQRAIHRSEQLAEAMAIVEKQEQERLANNVPCPVCKSRDTYRISTLNRATSVAVFGLASGKIGKQYKCNKCGHLW